MNAGKKKKKSFSCGSGAGLRNPDAWGTVNNTPVGASSLWQQRWDLSGSRQLHQAAEPLGVFAQLGHVQVELLALHRIQDRLASHGGHEGVQRVLGGRAGGVWGDENIR